jgi:hypothetical protein
VSVSPIRPSTTQYSGFGIAFKNDVLSGQTIAVSDTETDPPCPTRKHAPPAPPGHPGFVTVL